MDIGSGDHLNSRNQLHSWDELHSPDHARSPDHSRSLDELGDEIAELSAHLDAATSRLLGLIREFDFRGGWGHGFRSCAHWLNWRVGLLDPVTDLRAQHEANGLHLHARTAMPTWLGEPLDVAYVIDVLHPRAVEARSRPLVLDK